MNGTDGLSVKIKKKPLLLLIAVILAVLLLIFLMTRVAGWADQKKNTRLLTLVSTSNPAQEDADQEFTLIGDGQMVDSRCAEELEQMLADCRAAGYDPVITASYRTWDAQRELYEDKVRQMQEAGLSEEAARLAAEREVPPPGASEHQLGLAVDLAERSEEGAGEQDDSPTLRWLAENCWNYGFILRYPEGKSEITGVRYVPDHFRYIGYEAAQQIHKLNITLEEYIEMFYS